MPGKNETDSEERLVPMVRAALAERMATEGLSRSEIATSLRVTRAAVTQYLKKTRGGRRRNTSGFDHLIEPLAEKVINRARSGLGPVEAIELFETAHQVMVVNAGRAIVASKPESSQRSASLSMLRDRLRLELSAAERYLDLANDTADDHTKLLLRMIASDSIRHSDVVSQVISWLESDTRGRYELPGKKLLEGILALEDSAKETSLRESIKVDHPVASLLLEWIDIDEAKHEKMVSRMLALQKSRGTPTLRSHSAGVPSA